jgi:hypothetical protein
VYGTPVPQARPCTAPCELATGAPNRKRLPCSSCQLNPTKQEGAAWAKDKDIQEATAKGDWLGKGVA